MKHQHNHSTLLGNLRRSVYYPPNGSGRDSYIMNNNGGTNIVYKCQGVPELGTFMKFGPQNRSYKPASYTRFQKYVSDGSGRDQYVVSGHGGQYHEDQENNRLLVKFRNTMRDGGWNERPSLPKDSRMAATQRINTRRLSAPKKSNTKYADRLEQVRLNLNLPTK